MRALLVFSVVVLSPLLPGLTGTGAAFAQSSEPAAKPANAEQPAPADASGADSAARPKPKLGIDSLLRPRSMTTRGPATAAPPSEETHGDRNRATWAKAFGDARAELREAEERLEKSRKKMSEATSQRGNLSYNPLGGTSSDSAPTDPEIQKARAQMTRDRKDIEAAQKRLRELSVEASLAGVPDEWIAPPSAPRPQVAPADSTPPSADSTRPQ